MIGTLLSLALIAQQSPVYGKHHPTPPRADSCLCACACPTCGCKVAPPAVSASPAWKVGDVVFLSGAYGLISIDRPGYGTTDLTRPFLLVENTPANPTEWLISAIDPPGYRYKAPSDIFSKVPVFKSPGGDPPVTPIPSVAPVVHTRTDAAGQGWQHADAAFLESWVAQRNATFYRPTYTYYFAAPMRTCVGGSCR